MELIILLDLYLINEYFSKWGFRLLFSILRVYLDNIFICRLFKFKFPICSYQVFFFIFAANDKFKNVALFHVNVKRVGIRFTLFVLVEIGFGLDLKCSGKESCKGAFLQFEETLGIC